MNTFTYAIEYDFITHLERKKGCEKVQSFLISENVDFYCPLNVTKMKLYIPGMFLTWTGYLNILY